MIQRNLPQPGTNCTRPPHKDSGKQKFGSRLRAREIKAKEITKSQCDLPSNLDWQIMSASSEFHYKCTMGFWEIDAPEKIQPPPCDDSDEPAGKRPPGAGRLVGRIMGARRAESESRVCVCIRPAGAGLPGRRTVRGSHRAAGPPALDAAAAAGAPDRGSKVAARHWHDHFQITVSGTVALSPSRTVPPPEVTVNSGTLRRIRVRAAASS
jgi:hypothetical protein